MPRTIRQIERELAHAEALASSTTLAPSVDNDGRLVATAIERRASYARQAERLRRELDDLRRVVETIKVNARVRVVAPGTVFDGLEGRVVGSAMHNVHRQAGD